MLKNKFPVLNTGVRLHHESDAVFLSMTCMLLHNMSIEVADLEESFLPQDEHCDEEDAITAETNTEKRQRDALPSR